MCTARAPGRPPPPEAQLAPARAARRAPGSVPRRARAARKVPPAPARPAGPAKAAPLARPAGVYPQGGSNPWAQPAGDRGPLSRRKSHNQTGD